MKLTRLGICQRNVWENAGIRLPEFDIDGVKAATKANPEWIHLGAGNIFRGFIGSIAQKLLNDGEMSTGIIAAESFDFEVIDKIYKRYDNLTLNVMMDKNSELDMEVLAGIAESIKSSDFDGLLEIAKKPSLKMISFTITEKGYAVAGADGELFGVVKEDIKNGPEAMPKHTMSIIASMLYHRYKNGACPIAVVSMDNCSHNGEKLMQGVMRVVKGWEENGFIDAGFGEYIDKKVSFPWSMIDKITPRPDAKIKAQLEALGAEDMDIVVTSKNTYMAPFVNAEIPQYLVIEDDFPNGRPPLEKAGVYMTDRDTVNKAETMKVTTCLNPLHTALAVFGCLLGYTEIWREMQDMALSGIVKKIAEEGMKVVIDPEIIDPENFVNEVIYERLPNPNIPDAPQRIATDTSQKIPVRYGETIKSYISSNDLNAGELEAIPIVIAGWFRYLLAVDDDGNAFEPSPDPMLADMQALLEGIELGRPETAEGRLDKILSNKTIFGVDLNEAGLAGKIKDSFAEMLIGKGAVRRVLNRFI